MIDEGIQATNAGAVEVWRVPGHREVVEQGDCGNLAVDRMLRVLRRQAPPHLRTFVNKIQDPVTVRLHDQVEPLFEPLRLVEVTAQADGFDALAQFAKSLDRPEQAVGVSGA